VAAWAILGSIWEIFESSTEGCGEAAAIRVAYHLGSSSPHLARISAYKAIIIGVIIASLVTSITFMCGNDLPTWFTTDPYLQKIIADCLPLVGIGNLTMTFGVICWHLIGAQQRFAFATTLTVLITFSVTIPLASISVYVLRLDLQGVVSSVVFGYATAGTVLSCVLFRSKWDTHASRIRRRTDTAANGREAQ